MLNINMHNIRILLMFHLANQGFLAEALIYIINKKSK